VAANITHLGNVADRNLFIIFDFGTANIIGPTEVVRELFLKIGIQPVEHHLLDCAAGAFRLLQLFSTTSDWIRVWGWYDLAYREVGIYSGESWKG
jgi:hypothetical protein